MASSSVPGQLLNAIKARKFTSVARLFASGCAFEAWTPAGHWVAQDGSTIAKIIETWFSPGAGSTVTYSNETAGARGAAVLEYEISWKLQPEDQPRALRQVFLMTIKGDKISAARVYCAGLHTEFPEVDLEKQRRAKGLAGAAKAPLSSKVVTSRAS
jgi:hypothetical protein